MSENNMNARIELSVEDRASAVVRAFRGEIDKTTKALKALVDVKMPAALKAKLDGTGAREAVDNIKQATEAARRLSGVQAQASRQRQTEARTEATSRRMFDAADIAALKAKMGFQARMGHQRSQEDAAAERQRRAYDAAALRDFRERFRFMTAMGRQHLAEIREAERAEAAANRTRIAGERQVRQEREQTYRQAVRYGREAFTRGRDAVREIARPPAAVAAAGTVGAVAGARRVLRSEGDVDAAEINARIYGGLSKDAARKLRDKWAAPLAESLGSQTDKLLNAYTDATKIGIPAAGAQVFAELATKTSEAWGVPFETVTDTLGTVNSILTSKGAAYSGERLRSVANTLQHLAAKQSTTPEKLISFLQRGAGGADVLGMSMELALAFGSASTSLGNQAGQSGSLLDYIAGRVVELPKLTRQHGQEGRQARKLLDALGYGGVDDVETRRRQDPDSFLPDLMERFSKIQDPKQQDEAIRFFAGREWLGEFGRMVKGADTYREAVKLSKEAKGLDAIAAVWDLHKLKLSFVFKQFGAGWTNILGEFGKVLSPMARQAGDYWLAWTAKLRAGGLQARFRAALDGLIEGFGFRNLPDMLKGILGTPGEGDAGAISQWKATAREFSAGIRDIVGSIKAVVSAFTGGSPEVIARWTGRILALSAALMLLSPVLGVLGGIISGIVALASAAASVAAAAKLAGAVGGTSAAGSTAAGIVGAGFWTAAGGLIAVAFLGAVAKHLNILNPPDMSKGLGRGILEFLDPGLASRIYGDRQPETGQGSTWTDPPARVQRQSASEDWRGLIKPASFSPMEDLTDSVDRLDRTLNGQGARVQLAAFGASTLSAVGRAASIGGGDGGVSVQGGGGGFGPSGFQGAGHDGAGLVRRPRRRVGNLEPGQLGGFGGHARRDRRHRVGQGRLRCGVGQREVRHPVQGGLDHDAERGLRLRPDGAGPARIIVGAGPLPDRRQHHAGRATGPRPGRLDGVQRRDPGPHGAVDRPQPGPGRVGGAEVQPERHGRGTGRARAGRGQGRAGRCGWRCGARDRRPVRRPPGEGRPGHGRRRHGRWRHGPGPGGASRPPRRCEALRRVQRPVPPRHQVEACTRASLRHHPLGPVEVDRGGRGDAGQAPGSGPVARGVQGDRRIPEPFGTLDRRPPAHAVQQPGGRGGLSPPCAGPGRHGGCGCGRHDLDRVAQGGLTLGGRAAGADPAEAAQCRGPRRAGCSAPPRARAPGWWCR